MSSPTISDVWHSVTSAQPAPPTSVVLGAAVVALLAVGIRDVWHVTRNVVTIAHEGGHALVALLVGRRLRGIMLHSDTSGVTWSAGNATGPGRIATTLAGYVTPPLLGLGCAGLLVSGHITALLWLTVLVLVAMLIMVRNAYGVLAILLTAGAFFAVSWFTSAQVQAAFAYAFTWFLVVAGIRPIVELHGRRRRGRSRDSDADTLARLTGVPGGLWVMLFGAVAVVVLLVALTWLVPFGTFTSLFLRPPG